MLTTNPCPHKLRDLTTFLSEKLLLKKKSSDILDQFMCKTPIGLKFNPSYPNFNLDFNPMVEVKGVWHTTKYTTMQNYLVENKISIIDVVVASKETIYFTNNFIEKTDAIVYMLN